MSNYRFTLPEVKILSNTHEHHGAFKTLINNTIVPTIHETITSGTWHIPTKDTPYEALFADPYVYQGFEIMCRYLLPVNVAWSAISIAFGYGESPNTTIPPGLTITESFPEDTGYSTRRPHIYKTMLYHLSLVRWANGVLVDELTEILLKKVSNKPVSPSKEISLSYLFPVTLVVNDLAAPFKYSANEEDLEDAYSCIKSEKAFLDEYFYFKEGKLYIRDK